MLIPLQDVLRKYNVKPKGVIHVGAHWAEEHEDYIKCGIRNYAYIEPCKSSFIVLEKKNYKTSDVVEKVALYNYACGVEDGESVMYVSHNNQGQSNSLLEPALHLKQHPEVVFNDAEIVSVKPLDSLIEDNGLYDMLAMDVQGFEGEVLKGAAETLKHIDIIYTEINRDFTYKGNMLVSEMEEFLKPFGFKLVEQYWPSPNWSWGDGCFISEKLL